MCYTEFDRKDIPMNKLVATTLEGKFHVFDVRTQNPAKGFAQVFNINFSYFFNFKKFTLLTMDR